VPDLLRLRIVPVLISEAQADRLAAEARRRGVMLTCHVKIDTGMGRLGLPWESAPATLLLLRSQGGLAIVGVCTHFASAARQGQFAQIQSERFRQVVQTCAAAGFEIPFKHIANSAAFSVRPDWDWDGVRCGILAYGYGGKQAGARVATRPVLQWKSRVIQVKDVGAGFPVSYMSTHVTEAPTRLAVVDVGYSDGYSRLMSNKGSVLIGGKRGRVVGRVTMNFIIADVGAGAPVQEGDEVVLIGRQGSEELWADELARWCQTIPYEVLTSIRGSGD
jgi:alanine racemase